jgi:hypothetical protein
MIKILATLFLSTMLAGAHMTRFEALSMLESGNNDFAIGKDGEVSRYQITKSNWKIYTNCNDAVMFKTGPKFVCDFSPTNQDEALEIAEHIMADEVYGDEGFWVKHHREPTDFEWYLLYSKPFRVLHPKPKEAERAQRFANLMEK